MTKRLPWLVLVLVLALLVLVFTYRRERPGGPASVVPIAWVARPETAGRVVGERPGRILLQFKPDLPLAAQTAFLERHGWRSSGGLAAIGVKIIEIGRGERPVAAALAAATETGAVEFAEPDAILEPALLPNDPWFANWQKDKVQIGAPAAWETSTGVNAPTIAVIDTGVDCRHEDLAGRCLPGWNFLAGDADTRDENGHGSLVAGVIGATANNGLGVAGLVWAPAILPLKIAGADGRASYSMIAEAIIYAADQGALVANNSYQSSGSKTVQAAARYLKQRGGLLVVSEGNYGADTGGRASNDIINVGAVDPADALYAWSSFGVDLDLVAPGCTGATTAADLAGVGSSAYSNFCGTSNATPEVAGAIALLWSVNPTLTPDQAIAVLTGSALDLGPAGWDDHYGAGRLDLAVALQAAQNPVSAPTPVNINPKSRKFNNQ